MFVVIIHYIRYVTHSTGTLVSHSKALCLTHPATSTTSWLFFSLFILLHERSASGNDATGVITASYLEMKVHGCCIERGGYCTQMTGIWADFLISRMMRGRVVDWNLGCMADKRETTSTNISPLPDEMLGHFPSMFAVTKYFKPKHDLFWLCYLQ